MWRLQIFGSHFIILSDAKLVEEVFTRIDTFGKIIEGDKLFEALAVSVHLACAHH